MYLDAMVQAGANTQPILSLVEDIRKGTNILLALENAHIPETVKAFVQFTFRHIAENKPHVLSAIFTFGREDLIPDMFMALVNDLNQRFPDKIAPFKYYLDRHIEVDGDHHSHLALQMTAELCGDDENKWEEATQASVEALNLRNNLWTGVLQEINNQS
jgi:pyrroloquinoline quinone (PQQ) biosynthesis protein C